MDAGIGQGPYGGGQQAGGPKIARPACPSRRGRPGDAEAVGRNGADQKDYAAAEAWGREAIEIDVQDADMHRAVAESLAVRDDAAGAAAEYEVVIELKPDDPRPRLALAAALIEARQPAKARKALESLLKQKPDDPDAKALLEKIKGGGD